MSKKITRKAKQNAIHDLPRILCVLVVFAAALLVYADSVGGKFVFDDTVIVQGNKTIQGLDLARLRDIFGGHYWKTVETQGGLYRPVVMLSYALNYVLGGEDPEGYHLVNVLLHAANGVLVFLLMEEMFSRRVFSFLSALLFVLHPIRTEGVASIVGRAECLSAFFIFIAWWAYVQGKKSRPGIWISVSVFSFILATLTKESAYAFILLLPLTDFASAEEGKSREAFSARRMAVFYAPYVAGLMLSLCLRYSVLGGFTPLYINPSSNPLVRANVVARLLTATFVFAKYLWLLICPAQLSADYSYDQIPLVEGLVSWRALLSLCVLGALLAGIALAARRARILLFCGLMFLLSFLIVSNWVRPIGTIMAERLLYFPSLGFTCALAYLLCVGLDRARQRLVSSIAAIVLIGAYALRTAQRNLDWRDHYSLFSSTARVSPKSYLAQGNYATILLYERNDVRGAIEHALKAARIRPDDPAAQFTLGEAYRRSGDLGRAAEAFSRVARLAPRTSGGLAALRSLAAIHQAHNEHAQAMETYRKILEWRPSDQEARKSLESLLSRAMEK